MIGKFILACGILAFVSCKESPHPQVSQTLPNSNTQYAIAYRIDSIPGYRLLSIAQKFGDRLVALRWILQDDRSPPCPECELPEELRALPRIRIPLKRIVALSSTHLALLQELQVLDRVVGVSQSNLIHSPLIRQSITQDSIAQVGYGPSIQLEQVLQLTPDAVFTFAVGDTRMDDYIRLMETRIPTLVLAEWLEPHPLGRLEWIRLLGILTGRELLADSLFKDRVQRYNALCAHMKFISHKPTVLTGAPIGENWQLTGGRSFFAQLIRDAQGQYLFDQDSSFNGFQMGFEEVLSKAQNADFWINPGIWNSRTEALNSEGRIALLHAFKNGNVLQHNKQRTPEGGDDFWELGMARPDLLLADLIHYLHPNALATDSSIFYQRLPEVLP